jgi:hypothetical protein
MMQAFSEGKMLRSGTAFLILLFSVNLSAFAAEGESEEGVISNVRVTWQGRESIFIEYDLVGLSEASYIVTLSVREASDSLHSYTPINLLGDIGANIRPGENKHISWRLTDDEAAMMYKKDVKFLLRAVAPPEETGNTELYIAGGTAAVGLVLAIVLLSSGKSQDTPGSSAFPLPPGRPR